MEITGIRTGMMNLVAARKIKKLQEGLDAAHQRLHSIIEDHEKSNKELQNANEKIVSINEKLQSINEEFKTSKKELEITNKELIAANQELLLINEQLNESFNYIEAFNEAIHEPMIVLDKNFRVKSGNSRFFSKFKINSDEAEGKLFYELNEGSWNIPILRQMLEQVLPKKNQLKKFEIVQNFPSLGLKVLLINAERIIQKTRKEQLILLCIEDITERTIRLEQEKDQWFQDLANAASVLIWAADTEKNHYFFNTTWIDFTGKSLPQGMGQGWQEDIHPPDLNKYIDLYDESFKKISSFSIVYRLRRADGVYRMISELVKPRFDLDNNFIGFLGTGVDISDQKEVEGALEEKVNQRTVELQLVNRELERTNNELQQFAYVASHDLQEPLRKIITFSNRIQKNISTNKPYDLEIYLNKIVDSSKRMSRLIDDLLNFSRSSRSSEQFVPTDLNEIVYDVLKDFDLIIKEKNAVVNVGSLPQIQAIPLQMTQLFHNMISNALKFVKKDVAAQININANEFMAEEKDKNGQSTKKKTFIEVIISDNGIGFDPIFAAKIFVIFQRLHDKQSYSGTGIGLSLCKKIVTNHGGTITANSLPGDGATFKIILPVEQS